MKKISHILLAAILGMASTTPCITASAPQKKKKKVSTTKPVTHTSGAATAAAGTSSSSSSAHRVSPKPTPTPVATSAEQSATSSTTRKKRKVATRRAAHDSSAAATAAGSSIHRTPPQASTEFEQEEYSPTPIASASGQLAQPSLAADAKDEANRKEEAAALTIEQEWFNAASQGDLATMQKLYAQDKTLLEKKNSKDNTALLEAVAATSQSMESSEVITKKERVAQWLLAQGANPLAVNYHSANALMLGVSAEMPRVLLDTLIKKGVSVNATDVRGQTALMMAADWPVTDPYYLEFLLDRGATIDVQDSYGDTALMIAARRPFNLGVRVLLERGADTTLTNKQKETAEGIAMALSLKGMLDDSLETVEIFDNFK